ncbi:hypothetical protein VCRA2119O381_2060001 [Vibrio crassostreae]|nr:hypothetical protein VCRA2119O381_2060001 [Vibrio crassostreae]
MFKECLFTEHLKNPQSKDWGFFISVHQYSSIIASGCIEPIQLDYP